MEPLLVGILAPVLAAVLTGVIALWQYSKNQRDRRLSVNRAVLAEIARLLAVLESHYAFWSRTMDEDGPRPPLVPFTMDVYRHVVADIGSMDPGLVGDVVRFYGYVRFLNAFQRTHGRHLEAGRESAFDARYQWSLYTLLTDFDRTFQAAFEKHEIRPPTPTRDRARPNSRPIGSPPGPDVEGRAGP